ncbi:hypothetical protein QEN19_000293 [Hanseniaspora menglaensis]
MAFDPIYDKFLNSNNSPMPSPVRVARQQHQTHGKENMDPQPIQKPSSLSDSNPATQKPQTPQKQAKKKKEKLSALCKTPPPIIKNKDRIFHRGVSLGEGGFARCFEVRDLNNKQFAAKTVAKASIAQEKTRKKLLSEIQIHRGVSHNNIVQFVECFEDNTNVYMILEMCSRGSLMDLMKTKKIILEQDAKNMTVQICAGIKYLHQEGIIHRDLKLGNVFFNEDYVLKIGDFGLAALVGRNKKYTVCGTPNYIAPEVLTGSKTTGHSFEVDVWAIGIMMYAMVFGKPPFQCKEVNKIYEKVKTIDYEFPVNKGVSKEAQILIRDILNLHPQMRPSIDEILDYPWFGSNFPKKLSYTVSGAKDVNGNVLEYNHLTKESYKGENLYNLIKSCHIDKLSCGKLVVSSPWTSQLSFFKKYGSLPRYLPYFEETELTPYPRIDLELMAVATDCAREERMKRLGLMLDVPEDMSKNSNSQLPHPVSPIKVKQQPQQLVLSQITTNRINYNLPLKILASECNLALNGIRQCEKDAVNFLKTHSPLSSEFVMSLKESAPIIVTKWVDYSNKHGFSYQLSTDDIGVLFNNGTTILSLSDVPEFWYISTDDTEGWAATHYEEINRPEEFKKHLEVISFFSKYMQENLNRVSKFKRESYHHDDVFLRRYSRFSDFAMFELSDGSFQFNFKDHNKYIISQNGHILSYVGSNKQEGTFSLEDLFKHGGIPGQPSIDFNFVIKTIVEGLKFKSKILSQTSQ